MNRRQLTTVCHLLRYHASQERKTHGPLIERPGGVQLTPSEMEAWADELEEAHALPGRSPATEEDWLT